MTTTTMSKQRPTPYQYECPICWRGITETRYGHCIAPHKDNAGKDCYANGCTFDIATKLTGRDKPRRP